MALFCCILVGFHRMRRMIQCVLGKSPMNHNQLLQVKVLKMVQGTKIGVLPFLDNPIYLLEEDGLVVPQTPTPRRAHRPIPTVRR